LYIYNMLMAPNNTTTNSSQNAFYRVPGGKSCWGRNFHSTKHATNKM
jgi:hypothetical protein